MYQQAVGGPDGVLCRCRLLQLAVRSSAGATPGALLPLAGCEAVESSTDGNTHTHTSTHSPAVAPHPEAAAPAVSQACRSSEPGQARPRPPWTEQGSAPGSGVSFSGALRAGPDVRACPGLHALLEGMPVKHTHQHEGV